MKLTINISAPEFVSAINNLAAAITGTFHVRADAPPAAKPPKAKPAPVVKDVPIASPALAATPTAIPTATAGPRTIDEVKNLAALKAKKVGATVIKGLIADTGSAQIADITDPHVLASLTANLDAL